MTRIEQAEKAFIAVRDELYNTKPSLAYNLCWKKPRKFYYENSKEEAIKILQDEANKMMKGETMSKIEKLIADLNAKAEELTAEHYKLIDQTSAASSIKSYYTKYL